MTVPSGTTGKHTSAPSSGNDNSSGGGGVGQGSSVRRSTASGPPTDRQSTAAGGFRGAGPPPLMAAALLRTRKSIATTEAALHGGGVGSSGTPPASASASAGGVTFSTPPASASAGGVTFSTPPASASAGGQLGRSGTLVRHASLKLAPRSKAGTTPTTSTTSNNNTAASGQTSASAGTTTAGADARRGATAGVGRAQSARGTPITTTGTTRSASTKLRQAKGSLDATVDRRVTLSGTMRVGTGGGPREAIRKLQSVPSSAEATATRNHQSAKDTDDIKQRPVTREARGRSQPTAANKSDSEDAALSGQVSSEDTAAFGQTSPAFGVDGEDTILRGGSLTSSPMLEGSDSGQMLPSNTRPEFLAQETFASPRTENTATTSATVDNGVDPRASTPPSVQTRKSLPPLLRTEKDRSNTDDFTAARAPRDETQSRREAYSTEDVVTRIKTSISRASGDQVGGGGFTRVVRSNSSGIGLHMNRAGRSQGSISVGGFKGASSTSGRITRRAADKDKGEDDDGSSGKSYEFDTSGGGGVHCDEEDDKYGSPRVGEEGGDMEVDTKGDSGGMDTAGTDTATAYGGVATAHGDEATAAAEDPSASAATLVDRRRALLSRFKDRSRRRVTHADDSDGGSQIAADGDGRRKWDSNSTTTTAVGGSGTQKSSGRLSLYSLRGGTTSGDQSVGTAAAATAVKSGGGTAANAESSTELRARLSTRLSPKIRTPRIAPTTARGAPVRIPSELAAKAIEECERKAKPIQTVVSGTAECSMVQQDQTFDSLRFTEHTSPPGPGADLDLKSADTAVVSSLAILSGCIKVGRRSVIHPSATIDASNGPVIIGDNCIVEEQVVIRSPPDGLTIGNYTHFEIGAFVANVARIGGKCSFGAKCRVDGPESVASRVVVGPGCVVLGQSPDTTHISKKSVVWGPRLQWGAVNEAQTLAHVRSLSAVLPVLSTQLKNYHQIITGAAASSDAAPSPSGVA